MHQKSGKKLFVPEIMESELMSLNCPYSEQDTCHQQPMC